MKEKGVVLDFASYQKKDRSDAKRVVTSILLQACHPDYELTYRPDSHQRSAHKNPEEHIAVTASVSLQFLPSTGFALLDWLNSALGHTSRYVLTIREIGTKAGKPVDRGHKYHFNIPAEVKRQIDWERNHACGTGEFYFQNYTGELNGLFIELEWVAAK